MSIDWTQIRARIQAILPEVVALRHDLHAHPELGYREIRTAETVARELARYGCASKTGLAGGTGVLGHLAGADGGEGGGIALRADMDALPIEERTGVPWSSKTPGVMHACGHDGHTAMLLGAARILAEVDQAGYLPRPVTLLFQPAEEGGAGAKRMIEDGALDGSAIGPPVAEIYGLHGWPGLSVGRISSRAGGLFAAVAVFDIIVEGHAGHAALPHTTRDPVLAACSIVTSLQQIASRNVDPSDGVVVSVTCIDAGTAFNIIPDRVTLRGTVRTLRPTTRDFARERLIAIAQSVADAHGCRARVEYEDGYPAVVNDAAALERVSRAAYETCGRGGYETLASPLMIGEDFSFYGSEVPSCFFLLGLRPNQGGRVPELHDPAFDFNDDAIAYGIEVFCRLALRESQRGVAAMAP